MNCTKREAFLAATLLLLFGVCIGRASTPLREINDLPAGHYAVRCTGPTVDGETLSLVVNDAGDIVRLVSFPQALPAAFQIVTGSDALKMGYGNEYCPGYHVVDLTGEEPRHFWSNLEGLTEDAVL